jgi:colanic acid/amylovoran biosynthesis glycosyltransferase
MRIAFLVNHFPTLSETFILNQVTGLIDRGHHVDIYATRPNLTGVLDYIRRKVTPNVGTEKVHSAVHEYNLLDHTYPAPTIPANPKLRPLGDLPILLQNMVQNPKATTKALKHFSYRNYPDYLRKPEYGLFYSINPFLESSHHKYDIIHAHFGPNGICGVLFKKLGLVQGKLITSFYGHDVTRYPKVEGETVYHTLFEHGDYFTGLTQYLLDKVSRLGAPRDRCIKLPIGIDVSRFTPEGHPRDNSSSTTVLTVARLTEKKGLEYSIRAFAQIARKREDVEYVIVGEGVLRANLESLVSRLGIENKVHLVGAKTQNEVLNLYRQAHLFILSSVTASDGDQEGQGLVIQEAQAMQLPVVSTIHNGIPEGVLPDESAYLVPERDVDALADRLLYLINNPEVRKEMGRKGRRFVEENYDNEILIDRLVEIYNSL